MASRRVIIITVVVIAAIVGGAYFAVHNGTRARAKRAIAAYTSALSMALRDFNPARLKPVATAREIGRVENYIVLLQGTNTGLEAELLELEIRNVRSTGDTVTATAFERWRELERNASTGQPKGPAKERAQVIEYTLVPESGSLKVYLSRIAEDDAR